MPDVCRPVVAIVFLFSLGATWSACDSAPGLPGESVRPGLASVSVTPTEDSLETSAASATVPMTVSGVTTGDGPVVVRTLVRYAGTDTLVAEARASFPAGAFQQAVPLTLPRGATGPYSVTVSTEGPGGRAGDEASAVFHFKAASLGPPSVNVTAPATVTRLANRNATVSIQAVVSDPDGRENIAVVLVQLPGSGGIIGPLYDEGRTSRSSDSRANDGTYEGALSIPPDTSPGAYSFEVIAVDRAGQESAPAPFTFTVQ